MDLPDDDYRVRDLMALYAPVREKIRERLGEFKLKWETGTDEDIFTELAFCLPPPPSPGPGPAGQLSSP
jgi:thermostable 8-oxoguanine DNA glycosylase